jgi:hypothetical protein
MLNVPTPIKVMLGLAAAAAEEAKKLPETLPTAVTTVPMIAVSTAMQASLRVQQHIATLAARGDEVLLQLRGTTAGPPSWATFDDPPTQTAAETASTSKAAFDRIDYEHTGFAEGDQATGRWDALGVGDEAAPTAGSGKHPSTRDSASKGISGEQASPARPARRSSKKAAAKKAAPTKSEPLKKAAARAKPSSPPNPVTMAAEIERAHEADHTGE